MIQQTKFWEHPAVLSAGTAGLQNCLVFKEKPALMQVCIFKGQNVCFQ